MAFRLCLALGELHPDYLLRRLTSLQWADWQAFDQLEPFGDPRADLRAGIVAAANTNLHLKPGAKALRPLDFMPYAEKPASDPQALSQRLIETLRGMSNGAAG